MSWVKDYQGWSRFLLLIFMFSIWFTILSGQAGAGWFTTSEPEPLEEPPIVTPTTTPWLVLALQPNDICAARYLGGNYLCVCATRRELYAGEWFNVGPLSPSDFFTHHMPDVNRGYNPIEQQACAELKEYF